VSRGYERIRKWEFTSLEFGSSKGTAVRPEEFEYIVCDVTICVSIIRVISHPDGSRNVGNFELTQLIAREDIIKLESCFVRVPDAKINVF
jgi:hypothetical protein